VSTYSLSGVCGFGFGGRDREYVFIVLVSTYLGCWGGTVVFSIYGQVSAVLGCGGGTVSTYSSAISKGTSLRKTETSSGRVFMINTRAQRNLRHNWVIFVLSKQPPPPPPFPGGGTSLASGTFDPAKFVVVTASSTPLNVCLANFGKSRDRLLGGFE
jgi:hypothetical protein